MIGFPGQLKFRPAVRRPLGRKAKIQCRTGRAAGRRTPAQALARTGRGVPVGRGAVIDASALRVTSGAAPWPVNGKPASRAGKTIGADLGDAMTRGRTLRSDATLVIDDPANPDVRVAFSSFQDLETGQELDRSRKNIPLDGASPSVPRPVSVLGISAFDGQGNRDAALANPWTACCDSPSCLNGRPSHA